jgi:hypothetical protein
VTENPEPLAVLLLPCRLEEFELAAHARDLLPIPRVVAVEPPRARARRLRRNQVSALQARRLRFPGEPRTLVLYHPGQYPLARALLGVHDEAELWYVRPDAAALRAEAPAGQDELIEFDELASARAQHVLPATPDGDPRVENEPLRSWLWELGVITHRPFLPGLRRTSGRVPNRLRPI